MEVGKGFPSTCTISAHHYNQTSTFLTGPLLLRSGVDVALGRVAAV